MTKSLAAALAALLGLQLLQPGLALAASDFGDVSESHPARSAIESLRELGIVAGYPDGQFRPENNVTRAELAKIVISAAVDAGAISGENCFPDVGTEWFAPFVCTAKEKGIVAGYPDGLFHPAEPVNFAEAAKIATEAFEIQAGAAGANWFDGFARALADRAAVPVTVAGFDEYLTRGELAEIVNRLAKEDENQASLSYAALAAASGSGIARFESCSQLEAYLAARTAARPPIYFDVLKGGDMAVPEAAQNDSGAKSGDHSTTNVQVAGVDEADTVKTDGEYLFVVRHPTAEQFGDQTEKLVDSVSIVRIDQPAELAEVANITPSQDSADSSLQINDIYLAGDRLVVLGSGWRSSEATTETGDEKRIMIWPPVWGESFSAILIYDISDRANPKLERNLELEGSAVTSRLIGDELYFVSQTQPRYWIMAANENEKKTADDFIPQLRDSRLNASAPELAADCSRVAYLPESQDTEFVTVLGLDLAKPSQEASREVLLGSAQNVFASAQNLYLATTSYDMPAASGPYDYYVPQPERTRIYKFALAGAAANFVAQGRVDGTVLNQWSMDEWQGNLRLATTQHARWAWAPWWQSGQQISKDTNSVFILDSNLKETGRIADLGIDETIYSARFVGPRAYLVTFRQIDPFYVLDLADAANPKKLGELKIPGFSNYLHPISETKIIGFGKDAETTNGGWNGSEVTIATGMKMALFDVSDLANPQQIASLGWGGRGTDSELLWNPKALLYDAARQFVSFPITITEQNTNPANPWEYGKTTFQGATVVSFANNQFKELGRITHFSADETDFYGDEMISRIVRSGDDLFTLSNSGIAATRLGTKLETLGTLKY